MPCSQDNNISLRAVSVIGERITLRSNWRKVYLRPIVFSLKQGVGASESSACAQNTIYEGIGASSSVSVESGVAVVCGINGIKAERVGNLVSITLAVCGFIANKDRGCTSGSGSPESVRLSLVVSCIS